MWNGSPCTVALWMEALILGLQGFHVSELCNIGASTSFVGGSRKVWMILVPGVHGGNPKYREFHLLSKKVMRIIEVVV